MLLIVNSVFTLYCTEVTEQSTSIISTASSQYLVIYAIDTNIMENSKLLPPFPRGVSSLSLRLLHLDIIYASRVCIRARLFVSVVPATQLIQQTAINVHCLIEIIIKLKIV